MAGILSDTFQPRWMAHTFFGLCAVVMFLGLQHQRAAKGRVSPRDCVASNAFKGFQRRYLGVFLTVMFADWLQGTHMYALYSGYVADPGSGDRGISTSNQSVVWHCLASASPAEELCHPRAWGTEAISLLFITGFATSSACSVFVGPLVDKYGRRLSCVIYCILEVAINTMEHYPDMRVLLLGRVLGGVSTSLLFVSFESWMVTGHRQRGFPDSLIADTYAKVQIGNGIAAVAAGLCAHILAQHFGDLGPFQAAIVLTCLALTLIVFLLDENYGTPDEDLATSFRKAWSLVLSRPEVRNIGLSHALFEGAMYTFVFNWVPTLAAILKSNPTLWSGLFFSCLMLCITVGGMLYQHMVSSASSHSCTTRLLVVAVLSLMLPACHHRSLGWVVVGFLLFEVCVGGLGAGMATMRSEVIPTALQASVMNIFRIPLNLFVVIGTKLDTYLDASKIFSVCCGWLLLALFLHVNSNRRRL